MDRENFDLLNELTTEQRGDFSKAVRDMVSRGRIFLSVQRYKQGEASLGRVLNLPGVPLGKMMTILTEYECKAGFKKVSARCGNTRTVEFHGEP
jgi:hypothetical protein